MREKSSTLAPRSDPNGFPLTSWRDLLAARDATLEHRREILGRLLLRYWRPIYRCVRFGWKKTVEDSKDIVQGFILHLLERDFLHAIEPSKGRFRSFLKTALRNYLLNEIRDAHRLRRGGAALTLSFKSLEGLHGVEGDPERVFEEAWTSELIARAVRSLEARLAGEGKETYFQVFERHDLADTKRSYREIAAGLGITESDVRNYLHYARRTIRRIVLSMVMEYALDEEEIRDELRRILG